MEAVLWKEVVDINNVEEHGDGPVSDVWRNNGEPKIRDEWEKIGHRTGLVGRQRRETAHRKGSVGGHCVTGGRVDDHARGERFCFKGASSRSIGGATTRRYADFKSSNFAVFARLIETELAAGKGTRSLE